MLFPMISFDTIIVMVFDFFEPYAFIPSAEVSPVKPFTVLTAPGSPVALIATSHAHSSSISA